MTGKQEGPYKGEETKAEEDKVWQYGSDVTFFKKRTDVFWHDSWC